MEIMRDGVVLLAIHENGEFDTPFLGHPRIGKTL